MIRPINREKVGRMDPGQELVPADQRLSEKNSDNRESGGAAILGRIPGLRSHGV